MYYTCYTWTYTAYTPYTTYNIIWLAYHSLLHGSTRSILNRAYINQLASCDSSPSSRNIVLKASVTVGVGDSGNKEGREDEDKDEEGRSLFSLSVYVSLVGATSL